MLIGMSLLQPNDRQTFLEPETPISDEILLSEQHRRIRQKTMHGSDDMSPSTSSSEMNKRIACGYSAENGDRKYVAQKSGRETPPMGTKQEEVCH